MMMIFGSLLSGYCLVLVSPWQTFECRMPMHRTVAIAERQFVVGVRDNVTEHGLVSAYYVAFLFIGRHPISSISDFNGFRDNSCSEWPYSMRRPFGSDSLRHFAKPESVPFGRAAFPTHSNAVACTRDSSALHSFNSIIVYFRSYVER